MSNSKELYNITFYSKKHPILKKNFTNVQHHYIENNICHIFIKEIRNNLLKRSIIISDLFLTTEIIKKQKAPLF